MRAAPRHSSASGHADVRFRTQSRHRRIDKRSIDRYELGSWALAHAKQVEVSVNFRGRGGGNLPYWSFPHSHRVQTSGAELCAPANP